MISFWIVVVVYVLLGLLDAEAIARKARTALSPMAAHVLIDGSVLTASKLRRFLLVQNVMSLRNRLDGMGTFCCLRTRFAAEWGVIAFTLNYIPFIGPFVATLLPTLYALAHSDRRSLPYSSSPASTWFSSSSAATSSRA